MTIPTLLLWSLTLVALFASIFALSAVLRSSDRSLSRQLSGLSTRLKEAEATLDVLSAELKAERQRWAMRAYRARKSGTESANGSDQAASDDPREWVRRTNEQMALARLGVSK